MAKVTIEEAPEDSIVEAPPVIGGAATAPLPPAFMGGQRQRGPRMEDVLEAAGAWFDPEDGLWYREVPDPRLAKNLVLKDGKRQFETYWIRRMVATGNNPTEALRLARADQTGMTDAYIPGRGWVRAGRKLESEHPDNIGDMIRMGAPSRVKYEDAPVDDAEAIKANALVRAAQDARGVSAQGATRPNDADQKGGD